MMTIPSIKALLALAFFAPAVSLPLFEPNPELQASDILSPQQLRSEHHSVQEVVSNDGFLNYYVVQTPFGDFDDEGNLQLTRRVKEAHALAELDQVSNSDVFIDAAKRAVTAPVKAVDRFISAPVATVKGIPGGLSRAFRRASRTVKGGAQQVKESVDNEDDTGEKGEAVDGNEAAEESESKSIKYALQWFGVTSAERRWAEKLGVDPYSSNVVLRDRIQAVAKVDAAASFGTKLLVPGLGAVSYVISVSNLVWSLDPAELRAHNVKQLVEAGISEEAIDGFLDDPVFSPTQQTVIVQAMAEMTSVEGLEKILSLLDWVESESEAWFYTETILLMSRFQKSVQPVRAIVGEGLVPGMATESGSLVYVVALDYLTWNETLAEMANDSIAVGISGAGGSRELWLTGKVTEAAASGLSSLGWSIESEILLDKN